MGVHVVLKDSQRILMQLDAESPVVWHWHRLVASFGLLNDVLDSVAVSASVGVVSDLA